MESKEKSGVLSASQTIIAMIVILLAMASVSGGFQDLSGLGETLAYSSIVMVPLVALVFLALRKAGYYRK